MKWRLQYLNVLLSLDIKLVSILDFHKLKIILRIVGCCNCVGRRLSSFCDLISVRWVAEYRTVSGVAGPLVILEKVKVRILLICRLHTILFHPSSFRSIVDIDLDLIFYFPSLLKINAGSEVSGNCKYTTGRWHNSTRSSLGSWWRKSCRAGYFHFPFLFYLYFILWTSFTCLDLHMQLLARNFIRISNTRSFHIFVLLSRTLSIHWPWQ